jgi:hypothetical protein
VRRKSSAENDVVREQARMHAKESTRDEVDSDVFETEEQLPHGRWAEEVEMRWIALRRSSNKEAETILKPEGVRYRADENPTRPKQPPCLLDKCCWVTHVLEELAGHDYVKACVLECERLLGVGPDDVDPQLGGFVQGISVDIDPDNVISGGIGAS